MSQLTGKPIDRVDGRLKVTGTATYTAEFKPQNMAYGCAVQSTVTKGRIRNIDTRVAERSPGVIKVMTYENAMSLHFPSGSDPGAGKYGEKDLLPLQSNRIFYDGQYVAIVIAETFEQAEYAATLVKVDYDQETPDIDLQKNAAKAFKPASALGGGAAQVMRGETDAALQNARTKIEETYSTPVYHHHAMEPHATIAEWQGDQLMIYDATQSVAGTKSLMSAMLGVPPEKVRVVSLFIGGGFGSKGFSWPNTVLTAMAANLVKRPVKLVVNRQQMFSSNGRRAQTNQKISLGSDNSGKLSAIKHATISDTSFVDDFTETAGVATSMIYESPNVDVSHSLVRLNRVTPCPMRAPGEAPGTYALEVAMDELAHKLSMDPVELRLTNYADMEPQKKKPFSSKNLKDCYRQGAAAIGWSQRNAKPGMTREGNYLIGYGMATATYPANRSASSAKAIIFADGHAEIECATQDIGTGTYTIMTQAAADALGLPMDKVKVKLGDSNFPKGANSGGSQVTASVGPAIRAAALGALDKVIALAIADSASPLYGAAKDTVIATDGLIHLKNDPAKGETYQQILGRHQLPQLEAFATTNATTRETSSESKPLENPKEIAQQKESEANPAVKADEEVDRKNYAFHSFGAQFVKLRVDELLGTVHIDKIVSVMDIGKVMNLKTAKNQIMGGLIFGIGMALMEGTEYDPNRGRVITRDLAQYLLPVHADMPEFEVQFLDIPDPVISPIGARGIGEIGITGITAAINNAVFNATGKRVRDLPIRPDKLI
jgi:xanthine dehydrogenase YagR molybdenum-binding subunit